MLELYTYWSFTLNNPTDSEMVLIKNPNAKYIREFVWTPEEGEKGTPHIQGWIRLQRNQSKAFVIKLYPRAHFRGIAKDEYNENTYNYAQKTDVTTAGLHTISLNDPIPNVDTQLYRVLREAFDRAYPVLKDRANDPDKYTVTYGIRDLIKSPFFKLVEEVELEEVERKANLEKIFISATYEKMKQKYWRQILTRIYTYDATEIQETSPEEDEEGSEQTCDEEADSCTDQGSEYDCGEED